MSRICHESHQNICESCSYERFDKLHVHWSTSYIVSSSVLIDSDLFLKVLWKSAGTPTCLEKIALAMSAKTPMTTASTKKRVTNKTTNIMSATSQLCYALLPTQQYCCISIANTSCIQRNFLQSNEPWCTHLNFAQINHAHLTKDFIILKWKISPRPNYDS